MQLPGYQVQNALLNYAPISEGLDTWRQGQEAVRRNDVAKASGNALMAGDYKGAMGTALAGDRADLAGLAMQAKSQASQEANHALDREHKMAIMYGGVAQQALQSKDPRVMQQAWQRMVSSHPEFAAKVQQFGVDPNDHAAGLNFVMAQAAGYRDPQDRALKQAQINNLNRREEPEIMRTMRAAGMDPRSPEAQQIIKNSLPGMSPMDQAIAKAMEDATRPRQTAPMQQQGGIVPQSYGGDMGPDGGIIPVQTAPQPMQQQAPQEPMVNTPMGPMPKSKADMLGFALALKGKGDAGKMLTGAEALGKEAQNQNDKAALNSIEQASRLESIAAKFKPEYQTYENTVQMGLNNFMDSFEATRRNVSPEQRQRMAEYTQFRQDAMNNLSAYIKEITGAAMGIQEEGRIRSGMPDPAKDGPTQFEAKLKNSIATAKLALARHSYLKRNGYDDGSIAALAKSDKLGTIHSLDDMKSMINQRMEQAAQQIKKANPGIDDMTLRQQLRQVQRKEFGI